MRKPRKPCLFHCEEGQKLGRSPNMPVIQIVAYEKGTYLWIGNNAKGDKACFATLSGSRTLRRLAHVILDCLGDKE